jgi:putative flippase GtrA
MQPASTRQNSSLLAKLARHTSVRYLFVGGLSFLVDFGLLALLSQVIGWPLWIATSVAFLVSFAFTYTMQRVVAFSSQAPHGSSLAKYAVLVAFNTVASVVIVELASSTVLGWGGGKVLATVVTTVWNYFSYKYWVYAHPSPARRE